MNKAKVTITFLDMNKKTNYTIKAEGNFTAGMLLHSILALSTFVAKTLNGMTKLESQTSFMEIDGKRV